MLSQLCPLTTDEETYMTLASDVPSILTALIPLAIVVGIFIVRPLARRGTSQMWADAKHRRDELGQKQDQVLSELAAIRTRLDNIDRVLSSVD
jgi:hypothetical protein